VETPQSLSELKRALGSDARLLGGGTDLQLCRRQGIAAPARLISTARVMELTELSVPSQGPIVIGAAVTLAALAQAVSERAPAVAETIAQIATPQIRNVATVAGNLLQVKRCWFFRNGFDCYKRSGSPLAPCYAVEGDHRFYHAVIDGHRCQAVTPSDLATVLVALDALVEIEGVTGRFTLPIERLYAGPGETVLGARGVVMRIVIPAAALERRTAWRKLNLWQGDFAVASAALSVAVDGTGRCTAARLCLGAVAPVPWRARATERRLVGEPLTPQRLRVALDAELNRHAHPLKRNGWKLDAAAGLAEQAAALVLSSAGTLTQETGTYG
jgi:CO/xanthine dehydrogenase FAD-binding subunit